MPGSTLEENISEDGLFLQLRFSRKLVAVSESNPNIVMSGMGEHARPRGRNDLLMADAYINPPMLERLEKTRPGKKNPGIFPRIPDYPN